MAYVNGLRPGLHGQILVSSGLQDLDKLLDGGLPLESVVLVVEDGVSGHHKTLVRYFLGEGVACGQSCILAAADPSVSSSPESWLPKEGKPTPKEAKEDEEEAEKEEAELRIAWQYRRYIKARQEETEAATLEAQRQQKASSSGFRKAGSSGPVKTGAGLKWCHDYDLTKPMGAEYVKEKGSELTVVDGSQPRSLSSVAESVASFMSRVGPQQPASAPPQPAAEQAPSTPTPSTSSPAPAAVPAPSSSGRPLHPALAARLAARQQQLQQQQAGSEGGPAPGPAPRAPPAPTSGPISSGQVASIPANEVCRVALLSLGAIGWAGEGDQETVEQREGRLFASVHRLKMLLRGKRACAILTVPASVLSESMLMRLQYLCHGVLSLEPLSDSSEVASLVRDQQSCAGLLRVVKLPSVGSLCPALPDVDLFLIRHRRRRIAVQPIELDPDIAAGEAGDQAQTPAADGEKKGAGSAAAAKKSSGASTGLEF